MPSVRQIAPFIGNHDTINMPSIYLNRPFVRTSEVCSGFSLIELIAAMVVLAILAAIGYPAMQRFIAEERARSHVNDFVADFNISRSEAITRKETIIICPFNLVAGVPTCGADWMGGWLIFADSNGNNALDSPPDTVLVQHVGVQGLVTLRQRDAATPPNVIAPTPFRIDTTGATSVVAAAPPFPPPGSLSFCDSRGPADGRRVSISAAGQARTDKIGAGGAC